MKVKRSIRIQQLRQAALEVLLLRARSDAFGEAEAFHVEIGPFTILYRTPFQKLPVLSLKMRELEVMTGRKLKPADYGLDIWYGRKVMNIEWDEDQPVRVVSFRRGDWEEEFLSCAAAAVAGEGSA